ncbi:MAG: glycosyl hydrolase [Bacteroidetes bacterium]|nr:glycosyl hydrolase [Bacteroidota bacterium]NCQ10807.1 glycosyl hydrolase [Bacteroidota bacterium]
MSFRIDHKSTYSASATQTYKGYTEDISSEEMSDLFLEIMKNGVHGFCFSIYEEGQKPGDVISAEQIRKRLLILKNHSTWVRSFSCVEGNELVPIIAKELGMKTLVGAWLGSDREKNEEEIKGLLKLAKDGYVDVAAVGNEVLYRHDLNDNELIEYIERVKKEIPEVPVGYVDAYYEFAAKPHITAACDVILCNCYPYWEGTSIDDSFNHMRQMFQHVVNVANGKRILITETGWPSNGESLRGAVPSHENALKYFINTQLWSKDNNIEVFYFSSFDESWKKGAEGEVGAFWGIWDSNGKLKF